MTAYGFMRSLIGSLPVGDVVSASVKNGDSVFARGGGFKFEPSYVGCYEIWRRDGMDF